MQDVIYKAVDNEIPIYYSNTDCLCLREADVDRLAEATGRRFVTEKPRLGDFAREYPEPTRKFICLSQRKYIHCFPNDPPQVRYGPRDKNRDPEEYFERLYQYIINQ
jgi:hypothetical protein